MRLELKSWQCLLPDAFLYGPGPPVDGYVRMRVKFWSHEWQKKMTMDLSVSVEMSKDAEATLRFLRHYAEQLAEAEVEATREA